MGLEASGSCLRNGLGVRLHTDTASSHRARSAEGKICCLFTVLLPFLACYLFYFFLGSRAPPPSSAIMSAQIRQLWGLLTMPTLQAVRKLRRRSMARHTLLYPLQNREVSHVHRGCGGLLLYAGQRQAKGDLDSTKVPVCTHNCI